MLKSPVLVLNENYQPINVCNVKRAFILLHLGKAELVIRGTDTIRSMRTNFPSPSVIRLLYMIKLPNIKRRLSRQAIFHRDGFACQYCGNNNKSLTLDHVKPRSRGGQHTWNNVVSACITCNHKKAGQTLKEARMSLLHKPVMPRPNPYYQLLHRNILEEWRPFIPWTQ